MQAFCLVCLRPAPAEFRFGENEVELVRSCPDHAETSAIVSVDREYFRRCIDAASGGPALPNPLILELLDDCNLKCPTCIAGSAPGLGNLRSPAEYRKRLDILFESAPRPGVLLSGGEPTIHTELPEFIRLVEEINVPRRVLITNGVRFAHDKAFRTGLRKAFRSPWEIFLQFDSLNRDALIDIRGADLRSVRLAALEYFEREQLGVTLVCVVKRGINDTEVDRLVEFAKSWKCVRGIQFQPIRDAGRLDNYRHSDHSSDLSQVRNRLLASQVVPDLVPHPRSPLSVSIGYFNRDTNSWSTTFEGTRSESYIEESRSPDEWFRVCVLEYSDVRNWSTVKAQSSPLDVLQDDGTALSVDTHFATEVTTIPFHNEGRPGVPGQQVRSRKVGGHEVRT